MNLFSTKRRTKLVFPTLELPRRTVLIFTSIIVRYANILSTGYFNVVMRTWRRKVDTSNLRKHNTSINYF